MGEIAVIDKKPSVPAFTFNDMQHMAGAFAQGGMFGTKDPNAVLSLMLVAQAEGKHPAQIMQDYHVVQGKPAKKADAMLRDFIGSGGKVEWHELSDDIADATFSHPQGGSVRITWDNARVQQAGIGGNAMHKKYPRAMKRSRVVSEGVRTVFPGATGGFYVPEEVADFDDKPARPEPKRIEAKSDDARAKAEAWADEHVAAIAETDDPDALSKASEKAIAKLEKTYPDLFERVVQAWAQRKEQEGGDDAEEEDTPPSDDVLAELASAIEQATSAADLDAIAEKVNGLDGIPDDDLADLEAAIAAKRRKVK